MKNSPEKLMEETNRFVPDRISDGSPGSTAVLYPGDGVNLSEREFDNVPFWGFSAFVISLVLFSLRPFSLMGFIFTGLILSSLVFRRRFRLSRFSEAALILGFVGILYLIQGDRHIPVRSNVLAAFHLPVYYVIVGISVWLTVKVFKVKKMGDIHLGYVLSLLLVSAATFHSFAENNYLWSILFLVYVSVSIFYFHETELLSCLRVATKQEFRSYQTLSLLVILLVLFSLSYVSAVHLQTQERKVFRVLMERFMNLPKFSFSGTSQLGMMESIQQSREPAIRVYRDVQSIERVRGMVYNNYVRGGRWTAKPAERVTPVPVVSSRFIRDLTIENQSLYPLNLSFHEERYAKDRYFREHYQVLLKMNNLVYRPAGGFLVSGDISGGITLDSLGNATSEPHVSLQDYDLVSVRLKRLESIDSDLPTGADLEVPEELRGDLVHLAQGMIGSARNDVEKAFAVEQYLQENYPYRRGFVRKIEAMDPVHEFLVHRREAHCEYFASGMVLMLRSLGIPSRYVLGFAVPEYVRPGNYFLAREKDAHAWVLVYLKDQGWVEFDPTPPSNQPDQSTIDSVDYLDYFRVKISGIFAGFRELLATGNFGRLFRELGDLVKSLPDYRVLLPMLFLVVLGVISVRRGYFRKGIFTFVRSKAERKAGQVETAGEREMVKLLREFDRTLQKLQEPRPLHMTLLEFSLYLESRVSENSKLTVEKVRGYREFLAMYSGIRYRGEGVGGEELKRLREYLVRRSVFGGLRSEVGGQSSEVGGRRSEVGGQASEVRG